MKYRYIGVVGALVACLVALILGTTFTRAPTTQTNETANYVVRLGIDATSPGDRVITVDLSPSSAISRPNAAVDRVSIIPTMPSDGMGAPVVVARSTAPGRYVAMGVRCAMAGTWDLAVRISAAGKEETTHFTIAVP